MEHIPIYSVVDNMPYDKSDGFAFVIEDQPNGERWKYNQHLDTVDKENAVEWARNLNLLWEVDNGPS